MLGYGEIHHGAGDKPDGNTVYEIGSITKAFTGTLLGDMVSRGIVKLDAPLQDFMPPDVKLHLVKDHPIKLVDVASQSSGLPRMPYNFGPKDIKNPYADYTPELMYAFLGKHELRRPPGKYEYSNLGMGLLGHVLATKAGKTYEQLVVERICDPLEMNDTRMKLSDDQKKRFAPPYDAELNDEKNWDFDALAGAGALRSTANDMLKFAAASISDEKSDFVRAVHEAWKPHYGKPGDIRVGPGLAPGARWRQLVAQRSDGRLFLGAVCISAEEDGRCRAVQYGHGAYDAAGGEDFAIDAWENTGSDQPA